MMQYSINQFFNKHDKKANPETSSGLHLYFSKSFSSIPAV